MDGFYGTYYILQDCSEKVELIYATNKNGHINQNFDISNNTEFHPFSLFLLSTESPLKSCFFSC